METKVKLLYIFTIVSILTFGTMQGYWLYSRYVYSINSVEKELYEKSMTVLNDYLEYRKQHPDTSTYVVSSIRKDKQSADTLSGDNQWLCEIYVANVAQLSYGDSIEYENIIPIYKSGQSKGIDKYPFNVTNPPSEQELYESVRIFCANVRSPFVPDKLKEKLSKKGIEVSSIKKNKETSLRWKSSYISGGMIFSPLIRVVYPYDILRKESVEIFISVPISSVIKDLSYTLCFTLLISIVLITCLIMQILTIKKQDQISRLRHDFLSTMLHELKRPLYTLKICISYFNNPGSFKKETMDSIISQAKKEIDNLTSYFSKLRELSSNDMSGIPVNITKIALKEVLSGAIAKTHKPVDKELKLTLECPDNLYIMGDQVYLSDLFVNLLENSMKYSDASLVISIICKSQIGYIKITFSDSGWGIPKSEQRYVFARFYRGKRAVHQQLPGIGLGLSYVSQIVLAHKGTLKLLSKENEGTMFEIIIPN